MAQLAALSGCLGHSDGLRDGRVFRASRRAEVRPENAKRHETSARPSPIILSGGAMAAFTKPSREIFRPNSSGRRNSPAISTGFRLDFDSPEVKAMAAVSSTVVANRNCGISLAATVSCRFSIFVVGRCLALTKGPVHRPNEDGRRSGPTCASRRFLIGGLRTPAYSSGTRRVHAICFSPLTSTAFLALKARRPPVGLGIGHPFYRHANTHSS